EGEVVTLLGSNGAGKSTTLRSISGLMRSEQGTIRFDGHLLNGRSPESIARLGISHVPEGRQVFPGLSVLENLQLGSSNRRPKRAEVLADLDRVFEIFPRLRELKDRAGWGLSGGEQQMLAIGRGIMARPRLLLLDEPSLGLAPIIVSQMFQVIRQLKESRTTLLLVEQNAHQALRVADRGYVLESGRVVLADSAADLLDSEQMRAAYLGKSGAAEVQP
ncbi:MAG TPA: ABC transporter ATP-binding protein, partial [Pseudonocardiaceae bacterium]|nr:ABC transporter ATP-binding protein [Pseudonocardiaceae bacterium]